VQSKSRKTSCIEAVDIIGKELTRDFVLHSDDAQLPAAETVRSATIPHAPMTAIIGG
jgi:hypothetical protein